MTKGFRRRRDGRIEIKLSADELALLRQVVNEMLELLAGEEASEEQDPLARMVGMGGSSEAPDDPVLARLFPDAYSGDPEAAEEFRRYTEDSLREQKRTAVEDVSAGLSQGKGDDFGQGEQGKIVLEGAEAQTWLRALNDVRLALGTRLGVTEEAHQEFARMHPDDSRYPGYAAYDWLSFLLESLVRALT